MSTVNVNASPTPPPPPPPPRRPSSWPIYLFAGILAVLLLGGAVLTVTRRQNAQETAHPTATATITTGIGVATATSTGGAVVAPPTATPIGRGATSTPSATPTQAVAHRPTNPTSMRVVSGSCAVHRIVWQWAGAQYATSYDVALYNPVSGAPVKNVVTARPAYTLLAGPGATVALKVRSRNTAGTAPNYYTPSAVGHVPPTTVNPHNLTATVHGHTVAWAWSPVPHATAYDLILYHYQGGTPHTDVTARSTLAHWNVSVTPGVAYHLKVRVVGTCAPSSFYTPATSARVGAL